METNTEESVHNMQELLNPYSLKTKGEILRLLVSQLSGPITVLVNITLSIVPLNVVGLSLDTMCTASSKDNFTFEFWFFVNGLFGRLYSFCCILLFEVNFHIIC